MLGVYPSDLSAFCTALKASGRDFVVRNLVGSKPLTSAELTATAAAGVDTVFVYKTTSTRARVGGSAAGTADATAANAALTALGVSTSCAVYFAVDEDTIGANVEAYFTALAGVKAVAQLGVWGPYRVVDYLLTRSLVTFAMQTLAWPHGNGWDGQAQLRQTAKNYSLSGINCNKQEAWAATFGQYRAGATPSPPAAPVAPTTLSIPTVPNPTPLGLVFRANDDLIMMIKDSAGNQIEARGKFVGRSGGLAPELTYQDISAYWDRVPCALMFANKSIADILTQVVENPTGNFATGIVCQIEETVDASGNPVVLSSYSGQGKSVATILSDFQRVTGARWYLESRNGVTHFRWANPYGFPLWKTIYDDIDFSAESGSALRAQDSDGELPLTVDASGYANRVRYPATNTPLALLPGMNDWDELFTEDLAPWKVYGNGVTISLSEKAPGFGSNSIRFDYSFTKAAGNTLPDYIDLGYVAVPGPYCDMSSNNFGNWVAQAKKLITTDQGIAVAKLPKSNVQLQLILRSSAYYGPLLNPATNAVISPTQLAGTAFVPVNWPIYGKIDSTQDTQGAPLFDLTSVTFMQLRAKLANPKVVTQLAAGKTWNLTIWLDQMRPTGAPSKESASTVSQYYVETAAVTNGVELPIETTIEDLSLPYDDATTLALLMLNVVAQPKITVDQIEVKGIQPVPLFSDVGLELSRIGLNGVQYPVSEVTWLPADSGDVTQLTLGDIPRDELRAAEVVKHHLDRQRAQTA